ncbi:hypothetical protein [Lederbergia citrea]|uniref:Uncharacterized protein n=1 Tax=Lederbergia citrea TaxID=2833581 RepID=A0A942UNJ3_9BACI|nr:hypothetical protein [Lederbergia citrea]MBS4178354.1 hypothetical protein [Lederbergia citrea]MBS4205028.1 hypothetical protein [Lederbergia citrea]MBS4223117.1 hypothetical protein [Lederbergia citrea]
MEESKVPLVNFVQDDRFELNSYLTYLFIKSKHSTLLKVEDILVNQYPQNDYWMKASGKMINKGKI